MPRLATPRPLTLLFALTFGGISALVPIGPAPRAQSAPAVAPATDADLLSQAQIEQLLAPVALFPDALLMQVLMAATYPLEIVQAKRWLGQGQNAALTGDALAQALAVQSWDPSVKSLVPFPDVLGLMNDQLEWTQSLGDAVLGQQDDVMNAIQVLRGRAQATGALVSGPQQTVTVTQAVAPVAGTVVAPPPQIIVIAPTQPDRVYVPVYNPTVVFGAWPNPTYPPAYFPPPAGWGVGNALLTGMAFATGVAVVGSLWGWATPSWGRGSVNVNVNRFNSINVNRTQITNNTWQHNSINRQGVAYRNQTVANRVGAPPRPVTRDQQRDQFRGRADAAGIGGGSRPGLANRPGDGAGLGNRPGGGDGPGLGNRPGGGDRPGIGDRPGAGNRPNAGDRPNLPNAGNRPNLPSAGDRPSLPSAGDRPNLPSAGDRPGAGNRPAGADRPSLGNLPNGGNRPTTLPATAPSGRPQVQRPSTQPTRPPPQALQGVGQGRDVRAAAARGQASRQAQPAARAAPQARPQAGAGPRGGGGGGRPGHRG